jgi:two-component system LytT family response regulator
MPLIKAKKAEDAFIKILIIEDNPIDASYLHKLINILPENIEIQTTDSLFDVKKLLDEFQPDVVISDIEVGPENSLDFFQASRFLDEIPLIITSNHSHFAIPAFKLNAVHYLEKPVRPNELREALDRIRSRSEKNKTSKSPCENLMINTDQFISFVNINEIVQLAADGPYTHIKQENGKITVVSKNLGSFESRLPDHFVRVNKSVIININFIELIRKDNTIELKNNTPVEISVRRKIEVLEKIKKYFSGEGI